MTLTNQVDQARLVTSRRFQNYTMHVGHSAHDGSQGEENTQFHKRAPARPVAAAV